MSVAVSVLLLCCCLVHVCSAAREDLGDRDVTAVGQRDGSFVSDFHYSRGKVLISFG